MIFHTENLRKYGIPPYTIALIHGGPGAAGDMRPVATMLSGTDGILEPFQTANSVKGQIRELYSVLKDHGRIPVTLIGHSWGAWLSFMVAALYPDVVGKLILVASGPFEAEYAGRITETRVNRLSGEEQSELFTILKKINDQDIREKDSYFSRFGKILSKADSFDLIPGIEEETHVDADIFQRVWKEAEELRRNESLLAFGGRIQCPVIAIHGDYDPHPAEGVEKPLKKVLKDFRFILLAKCGHKPWAEIHAREEFFRIVKEEIRKSGDKRG